MPCIFCKIIKREISADIVYEDKNVLAFLDINPVSPGHVLIVPKDHCENFANASEETICRVLKVAKRIAPQILKAVGATDFNLITNNGPAAGQSVGHLHFHFIPRGSGFPKPDWKTIEYKKDEMKKIAKKIKCAKI